MLATLSAAPLRELTGEQIGPYSSRAMTTVGDARDYRHFLPRIFELSITNAAWHGLDPGLMASKLNLADWRSWPVPQQDAVLAFFRAAFDWAIEYHPDHGQSAADWTCGLTALGDSPLRTFGRWFSACSPTAALQLSSFIIEEAERLRRDYAVSSGFWYEVDWTARQQVAERLTSDASRACLQAAAPHVGVEDRSSLIEAALFELEW